MQKITLRNVDLGALTGAVGPRVLTRGAALAHRGGVRHMAWDPVDSVLFGDVRDGAEQHEVEIVLLAHPKGHSTYSWSECDCPAGGECHHVVAMMLVATGAVQAAVTGTPAPRTWEDELAELVDGSAPAGEPVGVPLGVELSLDGSSAPVGGGPDQSIRMLARLVRPGRSGWVVGDLSWTRLLMPWSTGDLRQDHVRLLTELYHLVGPGPVHGYYGADEKTIDLAGCESSRLWALLDEAAVQGIALLHGGRSRRPVERLPPARLRFDVTAAADGALQVSPELIADGPLGVDLEPAAFLGRGGHGVVLVPRGERAERSDPSTWRFRIAELVTPVSAGSARVVLDGRAMTVPAGARDRFAQRFYHRLGRIAPVTSSDGAFVPPEVSDPELVLHTRYGDDHELDLDWEWVYEIDGSPQRVPLRAGGDDAFRDAEHERAVLAKLADLTGADGGIESHRLSGLQAARFVTDVLPQLTEAGVRRESSGEPVDYRDAGHTLEIGLSTRAAPGENDWFDLGVTVSLEGEEIPFVDVFTALAAGEEGMLLPGGAWFSLRTPELLAMRDLIDEARALQDRPAGPMRISHYQAGLWEELASLGVVQEQAQAWRAQVGGLLALGDETAVAASEVPAGLTAALRDYQRRGYDWLTFLWRHGLGGVLADDMGLGKTVQTLALICHAREQEPQAPPFLIVAPTSVVANWELESARFAPGLSVAALTDTLRKQGRDLAEITDGVDVVVTSYTLFRIDAEAHRAASWSGLILDEAQFVKNHRASTHECARLLPAPFRLAITGTPMENNLMELWALLAIVAPGLFPNAERFKEVYARPIERERDTEVLARLRRRIRPLMTRRTKEQVATDLPPKQVQREIVELGPAHRKLYQRHLQRERQKILGLLGDVDRNRFTILTSLTLLRRLSLHPGLVDESQAALGSSKIDALVERVREIAGGGHRALVFSQFTGYLAHVRARLDAEGIEYVYLDGKTGNRPAVVRRFREGRAPVFLISLKAGGFGLTLTEADYCFLLDPWWNPAVEAQAVDRTHRIGQTRNVMVYRMIARDTIEEKVAELADRKAELFRGVMDDGDAFAAVLGADDIRALLE